MLASNFNNSAPAFSVTARRSATYILLPALLWIAAVFARPMFVSLRCGLQPGVCTANSVLWIDRFALGQNSPDADGLSFIAQNVTGVLSFVAVMTLCSIELIRSKATWGQSLGKLMLWIKAVLWTGFLTELARLVVQRPRPFVYSDPHVLGMNPAHYVSFFSGHTSFATTSGVIAILLLRDQRLPKPIFWGFSGIIGILILTTGTCRILSGRHFLTDVVSAFVAGASIAWIVHRKGGSFEKSISHAG
jgi:membrane-associated phospholipid phosphatase